MPLVNCPECGGAVSSTVSHCPHCGHPNPGRPAAPAAPPRGGSARWVIFGVVAIGALVLGLFGLGVYRLVQRADRQHPDELVDFVDSAQAEARGRGPRTLPPGDSARELGLVEVQPELLNREEVAAEISRNYPPLLRDAGVTGSVTLRMRIRSDGVVDPTTIVVLEATHDAFGDAATRVASRLRFRPARVNGEPVAVWVTLPVTFLLR